MNNNNVGGGEEEVGKKGLFIFYYDLKNYFK